jgi:hypothetical protein
MTEGVGVTVADVSPAVDVMIYGLEVTTAGSSEVDTSSVYEPAVKGLVTPGEALNCTVMVLGE